MARRKKKNYLIDIAVLVVAAIVLAITMPWSRDIELSLGLCYYVDANGNYVDKADIKNAERNNSGARSVDTGELKVHFVDVGQGDCCIIELPDGKTMIIDGGDRDTEVRTAILDYIDATLPEGFKYFDYAILTHPDSDHCGSLDDVLNAYPARVSFRPNVQAIGTKSKPYTDPGAAALDGAVKKDTAAYADAVEAMYNPKAEHDFTPKVLVTDPGDDTQTVTDGTADSTYTFNFYSPLSANYGKSWNDYSPIMILEYMGFSFVMSGDAEEENLGEFAAKAAAARTDGVTDKYDIFTDDFCANVIKAGHHGSQNATTAEYLDVITSPDGAHAAYCVISCGAGNSYKHPHQEALDRFAAAGFIQENILRTDLLGDIEFSVRMDENGSYNLFYGDKANKPVEPDPVNPDPVNPDPVEPEPQYTLVYRELMGIKLKWAVVAWTCYAAFAVIVLLHIAFLCAHGKRGGKSGRNR